MPRNKKIDFLIFYEVKNREFESVVLLHNELVKRGYSVEYFSFFELYNTEKIKKFRNNVKVAVMPSLYHEKEVLEIVYLVAGKVDYIVNLRWEQVYRNRVEHDYESNLYPKGIAKDAFHCCWGNRPFEIYKKIGIPESNLRIVGPIQMDLLFPSYRSYYMSREELFHKYNIPQDRTTLLFISSFTVGTFDEAQAESFLQQFEIAEREKLRRFYDCERTSRIELCNWLWRLAEEKKCTIIYRPHPVERFTEEVTNLTNNANIKIISDENVKQWIITCDQIYSWFSTSLAEAYASRTPCKVLRPVSIEQEDDLPFYNGLDFIDTYEKFTLAYDQSNQEHSDDMSNTSISEYYDINYNIPSFIRMADYFESVITSGRFFPWHKINCFKRLRIDIKNLKNRFVNKLYLSDNVIIGKCLRDKVANYKAFINDCSMKLITDEQFKNKEQELKSLIEKN